MDGNVQKELYATYAVYRYPFDPIMKKVDFHSPATVVALVAYSSVAECIVRECNNSFPGISFCAELEYTQRIEVDFTPLPFE